MACELARVVEKNAPSSTSDWLEAVKLAFCLGAGEAESIRQGRTTMPKACTPAGLILCAECANDYRAVLEARGCDVTQVKCWLPVELDS